MGLKALYAWIVTVLRWVNNILVGGEWLIIFGLIEFAGKTPKVNKDGADTYTVKFEDEHGNKIAIKCEASDFERYNEGDTFDWETIKTQTTLPGGE